MWFWEMDRKAEPPILDSSLSHDIFGSCLWGDGTHPNTVGYSSSHGVHPPHCSVCSSRHMPKHVRSDSSNIEEAHLHSFFLESYCYFPVEYSPIFPFCFHILLILSYILTIRIKTAFWKCRSDHVTQWRSDHVSSNWQRLLASKNIAVKSWPWSANLYYDLTPRDHTNIIFCQSPLHVLLFFEHAHIFL